VNSKQQGAMAEAEETKRDKKHKFWKVLQVLLSELI
jgi:hypothetical protein